MRGNARKSRSRLGDERRDSDIIFKIKKYLRKEHKIRASLILIECCILFHARGYKLLRTQEPGQIGRIRGLIHTPDLAVTDGAGGLLFVVEQDGRIHESTDLVTRDRLRNDHYAKAGIPCIVLNSSEIRSSRMCMAESLDRNLEKLGMRKPAGLHVHPSLDQACQSRMEGL